MAPACRRGRWAGAVTQPEPPSYDAGEPTEVPPWWLYALMLGGPVVALAVALILTALR